jgi:ABC-type sugar transport system substrate-binding protein
MNSARMMKIGIVVVASALLAAVLVGCRDRGHRKRQIGFLMTLDHPYWQNMRLGAKDEAQKLDVDVTILNAREDPVLQIEQIKEMIAKRVDLICLVPMKEEPLVRGVQMLNRAGIPAPAPIPTPVQWLLQKF